MVSAPGDCGQAARLFRATADRRNDPADIRAIERLATWAEGVCRDGIAALRFNESPKGAARTLGLIPRDKGTPLVSIVNDDRGTPGRHVYLYPYAGVVRRAPVTAERLRRLVQPIVGEAELQREIAGSEASDQLLEAWTAALKEATDRAGSVAPLGRDLLFVPFRPHSRRAPSMRQTVWSHDPDKIDRGTVAHERLLAQIGQLASSHGLAPESSSEIDLSWLDGNARVVVEAKSITSANEVKQLRLGLGQLLDYGNLVSTTRGEVVRCVLAVERQPSSPRWIGLCRSLDVMLVWPEAFDSLFA